MVFQIWILRGDTYLLWIVCGRTAGWRQRCRYNVYEWEVEKDTRQNNVTLTPADQQAVRDMSGFRTQYTRLNSNSDDPEEDLPPQGFDIAARGFEEVEKGTC